MYIYDILYAQMPYDNFLYFPNEEEAQNFFMLN